MKYMINNNYNISSEFKLKKLSMELSKIATKMYAGRDCSHGIEHVHKVRDNAMLISKKLDIKDSYRLIKIEAASLFHDLWDHKYIDSKSIEYKKIKDKFNDELKKRLFSDQEIKDIEIIINNISLSREIDLRKNNKSLNLKHLQLMRDIVSDADKLEMLGLSGIKRIVEFEMFKNPKVKSDELKIILKKIYDEKISKLIEEEFIRTEPGREMAMPLMEEMKNYIEIIN